MLLAEEVVIRLYLSRWLYVHVATCLCTSLSASPFLNLYISAMHERLLMTFITVAHYQVHMTLKHFQGHGFKGQGHTNVFRRSYTGTVED